MSLTPEQRAALHAAVQSATGNINLGWYEEREAIFLAGLRMGRAEGREQAAKACDSLAAEWQPLAESEYSRDDYCARCCAAAIRALPEEPT